MFELDYETVDKWFEVGYQSGSHIRFGVFDKRVLLSREQVVSGCQQDLQFDDLTDMAAHGWIPMLRNDIYPEGNGFPLYVPSRIDMLLALEREGYSADELRDIAESEEATIDCILTTDDLAYLDDDLELLIRNAEFMLLPPLHKPEKHTTWEQALRMFKRFQREGIPERHQYHVEKEAFRLRAYNECFRIEFLEMDRARFREGYSPSVQGHWHWQPVEQMYTVERIDWYASVEIATAHAKGEMPTIRVPGFLLCGDKIVSTKTLAPKAYEKLWKQHDLDRYLLIWSSVQGEKRCLNCLAKLSDTASSRQKFCSEKCRNASKQKRYRQRHPEAAQEAQRKYWSQFGDLS